MVGLQVRVKGGHPHRTAFSPELAERLLAHLRQREASPNEPLLVGLRGQKWTRQALSALITRIAQRAGITRFRVSAHVIRHTIASQAALDKKSIYEIADMLNHRSLSTARRYIHGVSGDAALADVRSKVWNRTVPTTLP